MLLIGGVPMLPAQAQTVLRIATDPNLADEAGPAGSGIQAIGAPGPTRLQQVEASPTTDPRVGRSLPVLTAPAAPPYVPSEFERYVQSVAPFETTIRRFGADLVTDNALGLLGQDPLSTAPAEYVIKPGDEIALTLWGSVDADLRLSVDRSGRISVPRIGAIQVAGLRYADLSDTISRRVAQVFRNFQLSATLGQLRSVRVFVSGYVQRPGSLTVSSLSSVLHVIMKAGGPNAAGSFRDIRLRRGGREVSSFDLYDLLLKGDRGADQGVQADDVIHVGPVGPQVAIIGSVNQQAIFEMRPGETLSDLLRMAGGFNAVADRTRLAIERLSDRAAGRVSELMLPVDLKANLGPGDLVRAFSAISALMPKERQNKRVRIDGEVARPGDYVLPPGSSLSDAVKAAGGLTGSAYVYGTEFTRESVRQTQQDNYDRALRDMETDLARNASNRRASTADEVAAQTANAAANARLIERMRQIRPTGRVVLPVTPTATQLPDMVLEDGDHLYIPSPGTSVGVFGSVFNTGSFVFAQNSTVDDYLRQAGGPTRGADVGSMFVIRANGTVISSRQSNTFWRPGDEFMGTATLPGDTIFVPEETNKSTFVQSAKDWTQILYQFGLGLAGIKALGL